MISKLIDCIKLQEKVYNVHSKLDTIIKTYKNKIELEKRLTDYTIALDENNKIKDNVRYKNDCDYLDQDNKCILEFECGKCKAYHSMGYELC